MSKQYIISYVKEGNGSHVIYSAPGSDYEITLIKKKIIIPNYDTFWYNECLSFLHNSREKANSHHLIAFLPLCMLCFVFIYDVNQHFFSQFHLGDGSFRLTIYKLISFIQSPPQSWYVWNKNEKHHLEYIDLCIIDFLKTRLTFAVFTYKENRQYGQHIPHKT